jgi:hypothetical protein
LTSDHPHAEIVWGQFSFFVAELSPWGTFACDAKNGLFGHNTSLTLPPILTAT